MMRFNIDDFVPPEGGTHKISIPFEYYRIRKVKVEFWPCSPITQGDRGVGTTAVILDDNFVPKATAQTYDPYVTTPPAIQSPNPSTTTPVTSHPNLFLTPLLITSNQITKGISFG
nr:Cap [Porcine circovirus-like virus P1]AVM85971.1 Cap [Porcine circovirus-like virus P1]AVM85972.1 Cap [Porcine circovirus-like virus P1]